MFKKGTPCYLIYFLEHHFRRDSEKAENSSGKWTSDNHGNFPNFPEYCFYTRLGYA